MRLKILLGLLLGFFYVFFTGTPEPIPTNQSSLTSPGTQQQNSISAQVPSQANIPDGTEISALLSATIEPNDKLLPTPASLPVPDLDLGTLADTEKARALTAVQAKVRFVTGSTVNIRSGPGTGFRVIGQAVYGTKITEISNSPSGWSQIALQNGASGWMFQKFLSPDIPFVKTVEIQPAAPKRTVSAPTGATVRQARNDLIRQSVASYPGSCACPYNSDRAGRRCGGRSAWSRPGGYAPICYASDVSESVLASYFARQRGATN